MAHARLIRLAVVAAAFMLLVPTPASVRALVHVSANASVRAYANWIERDGNATIWWSVVAIREADAWTWFDPVSHRAELDFSGTRCEPYGRNGIKCYPIEHHSWELGPTDFFFDPLMERAEVRFGRGHRIVWNARGPYKREEDVHLRRRYKAEPGTFWAEVSGGNHVAIRRRADVNGRIGGWNLAKAATDVGLMAWQGSWGMASACLLDKGAICD